MTAVDLMCKEANIELHAAVFYLVSDGWHEMTYFELM